MKDPIAFIKCFPDYDDEKVVGLIPNHDGDILFRSVSDAASFACAIRDWLQGNCHAQYLLVLAHGILEDGLCLGIGSSGDDDKYLSWRDFWQAVYETESRDLAVYIIACKAYDGCAELSSRMNLTNRNPHLVSLNTVVDSEKLLLITARIVKKLVGSISASWSSVKSDDLFGDLLKKFGECEVAWPTQNDEGTHLVNVRRFEAITGRTFSEYLKLQKTFKLSKPNPWSIDE